LIQLNQDECPDALAEKAEYELHTNHPGDLGYRKFLNKVTTPVLHWLNGREVNETKLLDFGAGPGPTISVILGEAGWSMTNYDPFFCPDQAALQHQYDLITATEVVEHFHQPGASWSHMRGLLAEKGQLVIMTQCFDDYETPEKFQKWGYIREESHVAFYHTQTMGWIAEHYELRLSILAPSVFWFARV